MKKHEYLILLFIIIALIYYHNKSIIIDTPTIKPNIIIPIVKPEPEPEQNICDTSLNKALKENKKLLIIFGASWCGHCRSLKADFKTIDFGNYEICQVDIDDEKSKDLVQHFVIKVVPTSILIDPSKNEEIKRISGYIPDRYQKWLKE